LSNNIEPITDELVGRSIAGDKTALEELITYMQPRIYNLAVRMLKSMEEAEDASQEILIKILTHLSDFHSQSAFTTWAYRIAANHLINIHRNNRLTFDELSESLEQSLSFDAPRALEEKYDENLLAEEIKRNCTLGMLMCLNEDLRLALILGEVFNLRSEDAATILEITPQAYRKRLSRARTLLVSFVSNNCGLINPENPCRCNKHIKNKIFLNKLDPHNLQYVRGLEENDLGLAIQSYSNELSDLQKMSLLLGTQSTYPASDRSINAIRQLIGKTEIRQLNN
jgi:RNA polymerase sigma factor (sigma-70 family)